MCSPSSNSLRCYVNSLNQHAQRVFLATATGLTVSELLALKWSDVDFENQTITPARGIVGQVVGGLKTEE